MNEFDLVSRFSPKAQFPSTCEFRHAYTQYGIEQVLRIEDALVKPFRLTAAKLHMLYRTLSEDCR